MIQDESRGARTTEECKCGDRARAEQGAHSIHQHVAELFTLVRALIQIHADRRRLALRRIALSSIAAIALALPIGVLLVAGALRLATGLSGGFTALCGGRAWAGELCTGAALLGGLALGAFLGVRSYGKKELQRKAERYEALDLEGLVRGGEHAASSNGRGAADGARSADPRSDPRSRSMPR